MALLTWAEYSALHSKVSEEAFPVEEALAEKDLGRVIGPLRWAELQSIDLEAQFYGEQLKDCIAEIIDYNLGAGAKAGTNVAAVSNDGYSESYATELQTASSATAEKSKLIRTLLSGTGLVGAY